MIQYCCEYEPHLWPQNVKRCLASVMKELPSDCRLDWQQLIYAIEKQNFRFANYISVFNNFEEYVRLNRNRFEATKTQKSQVYNPFLQSDDQLEEVNDISKKLSQISDVYQLEPFWPVFHFLKTTYLKRKQLFDIYYKMVTQSSQSEAESIESIMWMHRVSISLLYICQQWLRDVNELAAKVGSKGQRNQFVQELVDVKKSTNSMQQVTEFITEYFERNKIRLSSEELYDFVVLNVERVRKELEKCLSNCEKNTGLVNF